MKKPLTVSAYFASVPPRQRKTLNALRKTIKNQVPDATEVISYGIPTFKLGRMLVSYAAFANHCSFFPLSAALIDRYKKELVRYETSRGTIRFSIDHPLPSSLVRKFVKARLAQNRMRDSLKGESRSARSDSLPDGLPKPAVRALARAGITNLRRLSRWSERDIRGLHGIGPNAVRVLKRALRLRGLTFSSRRTSV